MIRQLAIIYGKPENLPKAEAIATAFKPGVVAIGETLGDLPRNPLCYYILDHRYTRQVHRSRNFYVLDDDQPREKTWAPPNMKPRWCLAHITQNARLALIRPRTLLMKKGMVGREMISQGAARSSLPIAKGKWLYVEDMEDKQTQKLINKYKKLGVHFVTVSDVSKRETSPSRLWIRETGNNNETLWKVLMACDGIFRHNNRIPYDLYQASGRRVVNLKSFDQLIEDQFPIDLVAGEAVMNEKNFVNRAQIITREIAKNLPYSDFEILSLLV